MDDVRPHLGRAGTVTAGLHYKYDSAQSFSYAATGVGRTAIQRSRNPGYCAPPTQSVFFGERGEGRYNASSVFDIALIYGIPVIWGVEPWIKFDVRNVLNDDTLLVFNTTVSQDPEQPARCRWTAHRLCEGRELRQSDSCNQLSDSARVLRLRRYPFLSGYTPT